MNKILVLLAHPHLEESKANKALAEAAQQVEGVKLMDIYDLPFTVDTYHNAFAEAQIIVMQFPFYWGSCPSEMKRWIDEIFMAFLENPGVSGKKLMVVTTTGSEFEAYRAGGRDQFTIDELLRPFQFTALYSGMDYLSPFTVYSTAAPNADEYISEGAQNYKNLLTKLTLL